MCIARSAPWRDGCGGLISFWDKQDWLGDCANLCLEEIRPAEVLLPENWRKKFAFLSHVRRPGKAFLDHTTIWKLYPWARTNIKLPYFPSALLKGIADSLREISVQCYPAVQVHLWHACHWPAWSRFSLQRLNPTLLMDSLAHHLKLPPMSTYHCGYLGFYLEAQASPLYG